MSSLSSSFIKVPIQNIHVESERGRKVFTRITEMAESLKKNGFINPIMCRPDPARPGHYFLIAGERRYRGAALAGFTEVPITFRDQISDAEAKILELEENVCRHDLDWAEQCILHEQIDKLLTETRPAWTQAKTAALLDISASHVTNQIKMAKRLNADPTLKARVGHMPMRAAMQVVERLDESDKLTRLAKEGKIEITTDLRVGNCLDLIKTVPDCSIGLLLTDPPYGLDKLESIRESGSSKAMTGHSLMSEHHNSNIDAVLTLLRSLAPQLQRVLKPGAHAYVFCGQQYAGDFIKALAPLEWQPPFIYWDRGKGSYPGYGYNYMNRMETILMFHNPPRSRRLAENKYNILEHAEVTPRIRRYPTQKPTSLLTELIKQSSMLGETVLDLFAGSGSTLEAARQTGRKSLGFEIDPESWRRAQLYLAGVPEEPSLLPDQSPEAREKTAKFGSDD